MNKFKYEWVTEFTDCLVATTIWDSFPSTSKNWDKVRVYNWLEKNESNFKSYIGGASWDRTLDSMRDDDFRAWNDETVDAMNDCDDDATDEYNRFCTAVDTAFASRYEVILDEYEIEDDEFGF